MDGGIGELRVGGYQIRLRHGLPTGNLEKITSDKMEENGVIPGATICVRLLPHSKVCMHLCNSIYQFNFRS